MDLNNLNEITEWEKDFKEFTDFINNYWDGSIEQIIDFSDSWPNYLGAGSATIANSLGKVLEHANNFSNTSDLYGVYQQQVAANSFLNKAYSSSKVLSGTISGSALGVVSAVIAWEQGGSNDFEKLNKAVLGAVGSAAIASALTPLVTGLLAGVGLGAVGTVLLGTLVTAFLVGTAVSMFIESDTFDRLYDDAFDSISDLFNWLPTPPRRRDPLTLDLNGDGIHITNLEEGVYFDQDANGIKNLSQWISPEDGFLVLDRNLNGSIDNGTELFGDSTSINAQGDTASNGYDALAVFDINADGKIDQNDNVYSDLQVWIDKNSDGVSQSSELFTLAEVGVASISLTYDANSLTSSYTDTQQVEHTTQSVIFDTSNYYREFVEPLVVTDSIKLLPSMTGTGTVRNLHEAATLSVALENELASFSTETVRANQMNLAESIVINWAKTSESYAEYNEVIISPTMDKLYIVESFAGERVPFAFTVGTNGGAAQIPTGFIEESYNNIIKMTYLELASQTTLKPYFDAIKLNFSDSGISYDLTDVVTLLSAETVSTDVIAKALDLTSALASFSSAEILSLSQFIADSIFNLSEADLLLLTEVLEFNDVTLTTTDGITEVYFESGNLEIIEGDTSVYIDGTSASETINGTDSADIINAGSGNDQLQGGEGNDTLTVDGSGSNTLDGGAGDDTLKVNRASSSGYYYQRDHSSLASNTFIGGLGDDRLEGAVGADTYVFNVGDGHDTINDYDIKHLWGGSYNKTDQIALGSGIVESDLSIQRSGNHLVIYIGGADSGDSITIENAYTDARYRIEEIVFDDKSKITGAALFELPMAATVESNLSLEAATSQLIQAHSAMGNDGEDATVGEISNNNLSVLPVLDN
jgi:Ca2+-binding RTX toxin-like protein